MSENQQNAAVIACVTGYGAAAFVTFGMWIMTGPHSALLAFFWPATWLTYLGWWLVN